VSMWSRLRQWALGSTPPTDLAQPLAVEHWLWAAGSLCALHRQPFDADLLQQRFPPPITAVTLEQALVALGFRVESARGNTADWSSGKTTLLAVREPAEGAMPTARLDLIVRVTPDEIHHIEAGSTQAQPSPRCTFENANTRILRVTPLHPEPDDPDAQAPGSRFGFRWFMPELLKHRSVWHEVLLASLVLQLLALGTPLFTQAIIDKVVVHRTESTLIAIALGMAIFMVFSALLGWTRQTLVLHTGNRVDTVLGSEVVEHLFKLPPRYFEKRPTGVIAARLHGVETIREFIASAAVSLVLDLPFLLVFVGIMFWYSVPLTLVALAVLAVIVGISLAVAPRFQDLLNEQFLLGARNQAFLTEHVAGIETVKSLQMEPQLNARFSGYLADYLQSSFKARQLANTYNTAASTLEQLMALLILVLGALQVMGSAEFTIGQLIAFQMFSGKLSQPVMRLVGLWQQFQQAKLSVLRLGDVMDAPTEPYALAPSRHGKRQGHIEIRGLAFRHSEQHPYLYRDFHLEVPPGSTVAIVGASGSGKSTLAKLLQGFYLPSDGHIRIDGIDIRHLSANELRQHFGVVPQETVLFSGSIYDNLLAANPYADFDRIAQAARMAEINEVIEGLPQGYQTTIGERGSGLSGGQRQRLAIARALLKRPPILIFDEATSALDPATAEQFATTVNRLHGRVTMLFITHALPRNLKVDTVVHIGSPARADTPATPTP